MRLIEGIKRLSKLSFYLALGGVSALASACGAASTPPSDRDADLPNDADQPSDADQAADADNRNDADQPSDADADEDWDVIYE